MAEIIKPIAMQSKNLIVKSFFDLIEVKRSGTITISEIADNADIDRRTFYHEETMKSKATIDNYSIAKAFLKSARA